MNTTQLRNTLALMKRGESTTIYHVDENIEVEFNEDGWFKIITTGKSDSSAAIQSTQSLKEAVTIISRMFDIREGQRYQHLNGNIYDVLAIANQESLRPEYPPTVVYRGMNGKTWAKPLANFISKMTRIR